MASRLGKQGGFRPAPMPMPKLFKNGKEEKESAEKMGQADVVDPMMTGSYGRGSNRVK